MSSETIRLISNICSFGTIVETKSANGLALAKVKIDDRVTDFFPIVSKSNSFKKHYIPVRVGEQVTVFCPFGEANIGFILPSIFNKSSKSSTLSIKLTFSSSFRNDKYSSNFCSILFISIDYK